MMCKKKISTLGYPLFSLFHAAMLEVTKGDLKAGGKICFCSSEKLLTRQTVNSLPSPQKTTVHFSVCSQRGQMRDECPEIQGDDKSNRKIGLSPACQKNTSCTCPHFHFINITKAGPCILLDSMF